MFVNMSYLKNNWLTRKQKVWANFSEYFENGGNIKIKINHYNN